jgi:hypothetical protein
MKKELNVENVQIGGYSHFYIKDGELKRKIIPAELKDAFIDKFGDDLLNADEKKVDEFIKNLKQK